METMELISGKNNEILSAVIVSNTNPEGEKKKNKIRRSSICNL